MRQRDTLPLVNCLDVRSCLQHVYLSSRLPESVPKAVCADCHAVATHVADRKFLAEAAAAVDKLRNDRGKGSAYRSRAYLGVSYILDPAWLYVLACIAPRLETLLSRQALLDRRGRGH